MHEQYKQMMHALRAFIAVELNSYMTILAPPKHKNHSFSSGAKGIFLASLLQCTSKDRCTM